MRTCIRINCIRSRLYECTKCYQRAVTIDITWSYLSGFWKGDLNFISVFNCYFTSIALRFPNNDVFLQIGNDIIMISLARTCFTHPGSKYVTRLSMYTTEWFESNSVIFGLRRQGRNLRGFRQIDSPQKVKTEKNTCWGNFLVVMHVFWANNRQNCSRCSGSKYEQVYSSKRKGSEYLFDMIFTHSWDIGLGKHK